MRIFRYLVFKVQPFFMYLKIDSTKNYIFFWSVLTNPMAIGPAEYCVIRLHFGY